MSERATFTDWAMTGVIVSGVLGTCCAFELIQRAASPFGDTAQQRAVSWMARFINKWGKLAGGMRVTGLENVDPNGQYIIVSNHQSMFDIAMLSDILSKQMPRYVSKRDLARGVPGVSYNLRRGKSALIDRDDPAQAQEEIGALAARAKEQGFSVVIFPEGTRSKTGRMRSFRETGLRTLIQSLPGVPVLPATSMGGSRYFSKNLKPIVRPTTLSYQFHLPVMPPDPNEKMAFTAFVRQLEDTIRGALPPEDQVPL